MMKIGEPPSETELEEYLQVDKVMFIEALCSKPMSLRIMEFIRRRGKILDEMDIASAFCDTVSEVWLAISKPSFDSAKPMRIVWTIASARAIDYRRQKLGVRGGKKGISDDVLNVIPETRTGRWWDSLHPVERREFNEVLDSEIERLYEADREVIRAWCETFEDIQREGNYEPLARVLSELRGSPVSRPAAKSAFHRAFGKLVSGLRSRFDIPN